MISPVTCRLLSPPPLAKLLLGIFLPVACIVPIRDRVRLGIVKGGRRQELKRKIVRCHGLVQLDPGLSRARNDARKCEKHRLPETMERMQMHAVEQPVDEPGKVAFNEHAALGQSTHEASNSAVLAQ